MKNKETLHLIETKNKKLIYNTKIIDELKICLINQKNEVKNLNNTIKVKNDEY